MHDLARLATLRACATAFVVVLVVAGLPPLFGELFFGRDLWATETGLLCEVGNVLAAGHMPWLAPHLGQGAPLFANPHAQLLYPLRWPALLLSPIAATQLSVVVHLAGAAAAGAWLARTFGARTVTAVAGGLAFAASGTVVDLISHDGYLVSAVWVPAAWAAARRALAPASSPTAAAWLVLPLALNLLGGDPHGFAMGGGLAFFEALRVVRHRAARRRAARVAAAVLLAPLIAAAQLLPTVGEAALSGRFGGARDIVFRFSLEAAGAWGLLLPVHLGEHGAGGSLLAAFGADAAWNLSPYVGALVLGAAASTASRRRLRPLLVVAGLCFLFALGDHGGVYAWLVAAVPPLGALRYPEKYLLPMTLALVVAAACQLEHAARRASRPVVIGCAATGALVTLWALSLPATGALFGAASSVAPELLARVRDAGLLSGVLALAGAFAAAVPLARRYLPALLVLSMLPGVAAGARTGPTPADVPFVHADSVADDDVLCRNPDVGTRTLLPRSSADAAYNAHLAAWAFGTGELAACHEVHTGVAYSPLRSWIAALYEHEMLAHNDPLGARALGCTVLMTQPRGPAAPNALVRPPLVRVDDPLPRVLALAAPRLVSDVEVARAVLERREAPETLVDDPLGALADHGLPSRGPVTPTLTETAPDRLRVELAGAGGAVIAVARSFRAGWRAHQGEVELPVLRMGGARLAFVVRDATAGPVELRYRPPRLALGLTLSALALLAVLLGSVIGRRRE